MHEANGTVNFLRKNFKCHVKFRGELVYSIFPLSIILKNFLTNIRRKMINYFLLLAALWLYFAQLHAVYTFSFSLAEFTKEMHGFNLTITSESRLMHTLNIKCADCDQRKVLQNYIELEFNGKR